jgi:chromosome segregation ATPase
VLMDSIDANRQALRLNMVEGSTYDDYVNRMQGLNSYVRDTQNKIEELEKALKKSKSSNNAFAASIKKLKADIESRNAEIAGLKETIEKYKSENQNLIQVTEMQELDILDKQEQIEAKKRELTFLEQRIDEVLTNAKASEADGYFARAKAVEETANRTKLAPKKKKASLNQALELYRKALSLGNTNAKAEIERLENELK